jgi:P-type conjugative transfer protein TrbL
METANARKEVLVLAAMFAVVGLCLLIGSGAAEAADAGATLNDFISDFRSQVTNIKGVMVRAAEYLFWALATIQLAWAAMQLGLRGDLSFASFANTLVKEILFVGFFYWLLALEKGGAGDPDGGLSGMIVNSFRQLGSGATGMSAISPGDILTSGIEIAWYAIKAAWEQSVWKAMAVILPAIIVVCAFVAGAVAATIYMIEWYVAVPVGIVLLGLGGSLWTKNYAENYIRFVISVGIKLFVLQVVLGIATVYMIEYTSSAMDSSMLGIIQYCLGLIALSFLTWLAIQKSPELASGLISGSSVGRGSDLLSPISAAITGAAAMGATAVNAGMAYGDSMNALMGNAPPQQDGGDMGSVSSGGGGSSGDSPEGGGLQSALRGAGGDGDTGVDSFGGGYGDDIAGSPGVPGRAAGSAAAGASASTGGAPSSGVSGADGSAPAGASESTSGGASSAPKTTGAVPADASAPNAGSPAGGVSGADGSAPAGASASNSGASSSGVSGVSGAASADASGSESQDGGGGMGGASAASDGGVGAEAVPQGDSPSPSSVSASGQTSPMGMAAGAAAGSPAQDQNMSYDSYRKMARIRSLRSAVRYALTGTTSGSYTPGGGGAYKFGDATQQMSHGQVQAQMMSMMQNQQNMQMQMLQTMTQAQNQTRDTGGGGSDGGAGAEA